MPNLDRAANERVTKFARRVKQRIKQQAQDIEVKQWEERELRILYTPNCNNVVIEKSKKQKAK